MKYDNFIKCAIQFYDIITYIVENECLDLNVIQTWISWYVCACAKRWTVFYCDRHWNENCFIFFVHFRILFDIKNKKRKEWHHYISDEQILLKYIQICQMIRFILFFIYLLDSTKTNLYNFNQSINFIEFKLQYQYWTNSSVENFMCSTFQQIKPSNTHKLLIRLVSMTCISIWHYCVWHFTYQHGRTHWCRCSMVWTGMPSYNLFCDMQS